MFSVEHKVSPIPSVSLAFSPSLPTSATCCHLLPLPNLSPLTHICTCTVYISLCLIPSHLASPPALSFLPILFLSFSPPSPLPLSTSPPYLTCIWAHTVSTGGQGAMPPSPLSCVVWFTFSIVSVVITLFPPSLVYH